MGEDEVARGASVLRQLGFEIAVLPGALGRQTPYLAGTDEERALDLQLALTSAAIDGVICTRGGYGSMRVLPHIDWSALHGIPAKPLIGFSDITALQWALWDRLGWPSYSGPQLARGFGGEGLGEGFGGVDRFSGDQFLSTLAKPHEETVLPMPEGDRLDIARSGPNPIGPLLGGNLAVLSALCGSPWQPRFAGGIVLLEEIDEPLYRVDRMLTQLAQSGAFRGVRGVLLGRFTQHVKGDVHDHQDQAAAILAELVPDVPIVIGAPYGHVGPIWTVPLGREATLDLHHHARLILEASD